MNKKSQIIGMDLVMGVMVYLLALSAFFVMIKGSSYVDREKDIVTNTDFFLNNMENILKTDNDFIVGSKIYEDKFMSFASLGYAKRKGMILGNIENLGYFDSAFCIYITDKDGNIILHSGDDSISISNDLNCDGNTNTFIETVTLGCPLHFSQGVVVSKIATYLPSDVLIPPDFVNVNLLVCVDE